MSVNLVFLEGGTRSYIVIDENGEIKEEFTGKRIVSLEKGDRVLRKKSIEYLAIREKYGKEKALEKIKESQKDTTTYMNCLTDAFTKADTKEFKCLLKELDVYEKAFLLSVMPYVGYEDCAVKKDNGSPLNMKDFASISGMSERKVFDVVGSLKDKCIIYKGKTGSEIQYFMNPWLFSKGNKLNKVLKYMFRNYKIRSKGNVSWKDL